MEQTNKKEILNMLQTSKHNTLSQGGGALNYNPFLYSETIKNNKTNFLSYCQRAFTMAEVLITLGIIGIIAAMTLPALIGKYQKKVTVERLKVAYSKVNEIVSNSEMENGEVNYWDYTMSNEDFFNLYIAPYITTLAVSNKNWEIKDINGRTSVYTNNLKNFKTFSLSNGTIIGFNTSKTNPGISIAIYVDVNGITPPNIIGRDIFRMSITKSYGLTLGADRDDENSAWSQNSAIHKNRTYLLSKEMGCCNVEANSQFYYNPGDGCSLLIMLDGWEIMDDYPWK